MKTRIPRKQKKAFIKKYGIWAYRAGINSARYENAWREKKGLALAKFDFVNVLPF